MAAQNFQEMLEESLQNYQMPEAGEVIETTVIQADNKEVILGIGSKSEASIDIQEFQGNPPKVGDKITVYVERTGHMLKLSYKKAQEHIIINKVKEAFKTQENVEGKILEVIKGGFKVMVEGYVPAFLPLSQIELRKVENPEKYKNMTFSFKVIQMEEKGRFLNLVISRKQILEEEQKKKSQEAYKELSEGQEVDCKVVKINPKSVIVELNQFVTGLIRIGDLSWERVIDPKKVVKEGQKVKAKIIKINAAEKEMLLSLKDLKADPWIVFAQNHKEGDTIKGEVVKILERRVFVKIEEGVEGFIDFENLSWSRGIKKTDDAVKAHTQIEVKILKMDAEKKRLSLGIKQVFGDPWDNIEEKFPTGKKVKGKVTSVKDFGIFVELESGIEALLHKNDVDWNVKKSDISNYKVGDEVEAIVLNINKKDRKIGLGIKQLFENPWQNFASENPRGSIVKGKIKEVKEEELVIDFGNEVEGTLAKNQLAQKVENLSKEFKVGNELEMMIIDINPNKNFLRLSIREMIKRESQKEVEKYMSKDSDSSDQTLGDLLGSNFDHLKDKFKKKEAAKKEKAEK